MINNQDSDRNPEVATLKQVRERLGMTQDDFAKALGITRESINRYERGVHKRIKFTIPQIKKLIDLLEQAGMSINDFPDDVDQ